MAQEDYGVRSLLLWTAISLNEHAWNPPHHYLVNLRF